MFQFLRRRRAQRAARRARDDARMAEALAEAERVHGEMVDLRAQADRLEPGDLEGMRRLLAEAEERLGRLRALGAEVRTIADRGWRDLGITPGSPRMHRPATDPHRGADRQPGQAAMTS